MGKKFKRYEAFCTKCLEFVPIKNQAKGKIKFGRKAIVGNCPHCGTGVWTLPRRN